MAKKPTKKAVKKAAKKPVKKAAKKAAPAKKPAGKTATIYAVTAGAKANSLKVTKTASIPVGNGSLMAPDITHMVPYMVGNVSYIIAYSNKSHTYAIYKVGNGGKSLSKTGHGILNYKHKTPFAYQNVETFDLGGNPYLVCYEPAHGSFDYYKLDGTAATGIAGYQETLGTDIVSLEYSEIYPFTIRYTQFMVAYNVKTGSMTIYQLSIPPEGPQVYTTPYWKAVPAWFRGWEKFAFFQWGGENFFLKTNPVEKDVNIDHIMDNPTDGTHPVGEYLPLPMDLTTVEPFYFDFAPYFVTFLRKNGEVTFNRFHCDAKGWTQQDAPLKAIPKDTSLITPFLVNTKTQKNQFLKKGVIPTDAYILVY